MQITDHFIQKQWNPLKLKICAACGFATAFIIYEKNYLISLIDSSIEQTKKNEIKNTLK